ncbi:hypothetical protein B0H19DRAFT_1064161 [Mycena capillaripes]|nr:hypothetical protein B0H19DRAFT_1064161 [Mycena capillaripes]
MPWHAWLRDALRACTFWDPAGLIPLLTMVGYLHIFLPQGSDMESNSNTRCFLFSLCFMLVLRSSTRWGYPQRGAAWRCTICLPARNVMNLVNITEGSPFRFGQADFCGGRYNRDFLPSPCISHVGSKGINGMNNEYMKAPPVPFTPGWLPLRSPRYEPLAEGCERLKIDRISFGEKSNSIDRTSFRKKPDSKQNFFKDVSGFYNRKSDSIDGPSFRTKSDSIDGNSCRLKFDSIDGSSFRTWVSFTMRNPTSLTELLSGMSHFYNKKSDPNDGTAFRQKSDNGIILSDISDLCNGKSDYINGTAFREIILSDTNPTPLTELLSGKFLSQEVIVSGFYNGKSDTMDGTSFRKQWVVFTIGNRTPLTQLLLGRSGWLYNRKSDPLTEQFVAKDGERI